MLARRKCLKTLASLFVLTGARATFAASNTITGEKNTQQHNFPGGVVDLQWPKTSSELPTVKFGQSEPVLLDLGDSWRCLVGLALNTLPGEYVVYVKDNDSELPAFALRFSVEQKLYPVFTTNIPSITYAQRITKFSELDFVNTVPPSLPLQPPVAVEWEDTFGRIFVDENQSKTSSKFVHQNGQVLSSAAVSSQGVLVVVAPQNGIISNLIASPNRTSDDEESMLLIIDHGRGLFSCLDGLRDLTVKLGNGVVSGAVIGKIQREESDQESAGANISLLGTKDGSLPPSSTENGSQERIVFRWYCILNNAYVNPLILTQLS